MQFYCSNGQSLLMVILDDYASIQRGLWVRSQIYVFHEKPCKYANLRTIIFFGNILFLPPFSSFQKSFQSRLPLLKYVKFNNKKCAMTCQPKTLKMSSHFKQRCIFDIQIIESPQRNLSIFFYQFRCFTCFKIAKKPKVKKLNPFQNFIILNDRNF